MLYKFEKIFKIKKQIYGIIFQIKNNFKLNREIMHLIVVIKKMKNLKEYNTIKI